MQSEDVSLLGPLPQVALAAVYLLAVHRLLTAVVSGSDSCGNGSGAAGLDGAGHGGSSSTSGAAIFRRRSEALLSAAERRYLVGLALLEGYCAFGHAAVAGRGRLPFLPLLLTSVYCAVGVLWAWARLAGAYAQDGHALVGDSQRKQE